MRVRVCVCMCVSDLRLSITSGVMWCDRLHMIGKISSMAFIWQLQLVSLVGIV